VHVAFVCESFYVQFSENFLGESYSSSGNNNKNDNIEREMTTTTHHTMQMYARNGSYVIPGVYDIELQDAGWILVASIMIFR
jgi:hypothetical protein